MLRPDFPARVGRGVREARRRIDQVLFAVIEKQFAQHDQISGIVLLIIHGCYGAPCTWPARKHRTRRNGLDVRMAFV